jgi:LmeA-like phospholipid-binding
MFGGFVGFGNNKGGDWGENLINTVASNTIRHLFTRSDSVEVSVKCSPSSKLLQGTIDSFKMSGRGLVIRKQFRTEEMSFETDAVAIDFGSAVQGKIALKQPTQAIAQVKLSQADINKSFEADLVRKRLENLTPDALTNISGGEPISFTEVEVQLLPDNVVKLSAKASWGDTTIPVSLKCVLGIGKRRRVKFEEVQFEQDNIPSDLRNISEDLSLALGEILNEMVDLDKFNLDGVKLRLNRLQTEGQMLLFSGYAQIERVPQTG